jgi:hypothetical protein
MKDIDVAGLIKLVVGILTPAAVFYAVGYVITQAYVTTTGLQASFWFTEAFYREAGARFLLDIVEALALLPHLFIPLSALFIVLFPGDMQALWRYKHTGLRGRLGLRRSLVVREAMFLVVVLVAVGVLVFVLKDCGDHRCATLLEAPGWLFTSWWLFREAQDKWLLQQPFLYPMAIFLALAIPTAVTLGLWAYRVLWAGPDVGQDRALPPKGEFEGAPRTPHPLTAFLIASMFVVLTFYIPIAYGAYFYDFVVVWIVNTDKCSTESESTAATPTTSEGNRPAGAQEKPKLLECYLLGRFETRYILIGREERINPSSKGSVEQTDHRIYIKQVDKLEPFAIESRKPTPLRSLTTIEPRTESSPATKGH